MKELSIEEKAKAYDEAIERAKDYKNDTIHRPLKVGENIMDYIFPALKESEDERIRKALIKYYSFDKDGCSHALDNITPKQIVTWLEKQGEQKPVFEMKTPEESLGIESDTYSKIVDECIYGEQKPAWSEEDEKAINDIMWIIKAYRENGFNETHIQMADSSENWIKSLKERVQPKQEWSEKDENIIRLSIENLTELEDRYGKEYGQVGDCIDWLESLKDRVLQKPAEWSEENEKMFEHIIAKATLHFSSINYLDEEEINFLKSLRPQPHWKPSGEQIEALANALSLAKNCGEENAFDLRTLYEQLKKLKE